MRFSQVGNETTDSLQTIMFTMDFCVRLRNYCVNAIRRTRLSLLSIQICQMDLHHDAGESRR